MAVVKLNEKDFEKVVFESDKPVVVDFFATWCGPCKMLAPVLSELAEEHPEILFVKIDVDEAPALASAFGVTSIPTLVGVKNGEVAKTHVGFCDGAKVLSLVE